MAFAPIALSFDRRVFCSPVSGPAFTHLHRENKPYFQEFFAFQDQQVLGIGFLSGVKIKDLDLFSEPKCSFVLFSLEINTLGHYLRKR